MKSGLWTLLVLLGCSSLALVGAPALEKPETPRPVNGPPAFSRARFFPAPQAEQAMVGGKFAGSNTSPSSGFQTLAEIKTVPIPSQWNELVWDNQQVFRWLRYEAPAGSLGKVAELEFFSGDRKLNGPSYGSISPMAEHAWTKALDHKTETWAEGDADHQFVGIDLREAATARTPILDPIPGEHDETLTVTLKCPTAGSSIFYSLDGTTPSPNHGLLYTGPITVKRTATIVAVATLPDRAPSPQAIGTYLIRASTQPGFVTVHLGNSLTQTTHDLAKLVRTAGYRHEYHIFARPGAWTKELWDIGLSQEKERWSALWNPLTRVDHLTLQPRDFDVAEEASYDLQFINLFRSKFPQVQPWLYAEWTEMKRQRPTDRGTVPSSQMQHLEPALTWEESMAAMVLYVEEVQRKLGETDQGAKRARVLPSALAMGWIKHLIDSGKFLSPGEFYPVLFQDQVHPNANGGYLVDLTWFAAFYGKSPEGKILPIGTDWTSAQALALQRLAWDVVKNYPDCGLYEVGKTPTAPPVFSAGIPSGAVVPVTLVSETPAAWFRYTLDGTEPTRTRGYIYCGVISFRQGLTLKAVAYKSGFADSAAATYVPPP